MAHISSPPALRRAATGTASVNQDVKQDAIGRAVLRVNQEPRTAGDFRPSVEGGIPAARGPETYTPALLEAAQRLGIDPSRATAQPVLESIRAVPNSRGGMFNIPKHLLASLSPETRGKRTSDPVLQATAALRLLQRLGRI